MALRASSKRSGGDADIDEAADPAPARRRLVAAAGPGLLVEAGAVLGMFHLNDRVADAIGAPMDDLMIDYRRGLGAQMGIEDRIAGRLG
jgi:hypothetical protein